MEIDRYIDGEKKEDDAGVDHALRPQVFEDFPGQDKVKQKLKVFTTAAKMREQPMDHTLLCGPRVWAKPRSPIFWPTLSGPTSSPLRVPRFIAKEIWPRS